MDCKTLNFVSGRSGAKLASAGADKVVRLWEPSSATQTGQLHGMQELVTDLCFNCDLYVLAKVIINIICVIKLMALIIWLWSVKQDYYVTY